MWTASAHETDRIRRRYQSRAQGIGGERSAPQGRSHRRGRGAAAAAAGRHRRADARGHQPATLNSERGGDLAAAARRLRSVPSHGLAAGADAEAATPRAFRREDPHAQSGGDRGASKGTSISTRWPTIPADEAHAVLTPPRHRAVDRAISICSPASGMPMRGRPATWRCRKRRDSPSICETRPTGKEMGPLAEPWRPWRAVAARLLWSYYRVVKKRDRVPIKIQRQLIDAMSVRRRTLMAGDLDGPRLAPRQGRRASLSCSCTAMAPTAMISSSSAAHWQALLPDAAFVVAACAGALRAGADRAPVVSA